MITPSRPLEVSLELPKKQIDDPTAYALALNMVEKENMSRAARGEHAIHPRNEADPIAALTEIVRGYTRNHPEDNFVLEKMESMPENSKAQLWKHIIRDNDHPITSDGSKFHTKPANPIW